MVESERIAIVETKVASMGTKIDEIHTAVIGKDGKDGIATQTALNKQSLTRLWRFAFLLGAGILGFGIKSLAG